MNNIGKILTYDGYVGTIIDNKGIKYIFTNNDLKDKQINEGDLVKFKSEIFETVEIKEYTARFIKKVNTNNREVSDLS